MVLLFFVILGAIAQGAEKNPSNHCRGKKTCSDCITSHPRCMWCSEANFTLKGKARCDFYETLLIEGCPVDTITRGKISTTYNSKPLSKPGADLNEIVQVAPQEVWVQVRPNEVFSLDLSFRQAQDYPVDLYYLMDLSKSMEDDKDKLAELGVKLANSMSSITRNFKLGFGSFVDKIVMPYVSTVPAKLLEPCTNCAAPYGFKNHMPLSEQASQFEEQVSNARVSGNLDAPEGGFDAIMQSIVCHNEIGWRNQSRKLLIFSTDSGFHYAGDGKLGGIVKPNDGICHLHKGEYNESIYQDYPSLSQLRQKVTEKKVNIIFAVTSSQVGVYKELSSKLEGSYTGQLANDSSNVVDLVRDQYTKITSEVQLKDNATDNIKVKYFSECLGGKKEQTDICKGLRIGSTVNFSVEIEVASCSKDRSQWNQTFHISPVGVTESLVVHLSTICECDCEKPHMEEPNSEFCSGNGTYECGVCSCHDDWFGTNCECNKDKVSAETIETNCKQNQTGMVCSGRGACSCGTCMCYARQSPDEEVWGPLCECDNFSCDREGGKLCSGPDHGRCDCGTCVCNSAWTGKSCKCPSGNESCIAKDQKEVCSGKGVCECGTCKCIERYDGKFCDECPACVGKCSEYKDCVQCTTFGTGELKDSCNCTFLNITTVSEAKVENEAKERLCHFKDESDDCKFSFVYWYENNEPYVRVRATKECPSPVNVLFIVLAVIGGIVAIGLCLLLIWKLLTTIHDRREFAKFEKERMNAKWETGENPIFKKATSNFTNPTYGGKQ